MRNTADVTGGKPIAVWQSISGLSATNPLVAFCDIHGRKREMLFFYFVSVTTLLKLNIYHQARPIRIKRICTRKKSVRAGNTSLLIKIDKKRNLTFRRPVVANMPAWNAIKCPHDIFWKLRPVTSLPRSALN
jgi:hypothetical protein